MQTINISAQIDKDLNDELERIASADDRTKSYCVRKALEMYISHKKKEDLEDSKDAKKAWEDFKKSGEKAIPHGEVFKKISGKI
jgi:predicted transcriptional regulator